jgi:hypothetical protein
VTHGATHMRAAATTPAGASSGQAPRLAAERGQATILMLGVVAALIAGALILTAFGQAYGARARSQRVADLSAIAAAQAMLAAYPRLFEPPLLEEGVPNPRHLSKDAYLALARAAALRGATRNGQAIVPGDVHFPDGASFAPTRVSVTVRGQAQVRVTGRGPGSRRHIPVAADATAEISPGAGQTGFASGGGYTGPLAYRQGKPMRPDVAQAFDRMERAAAGDGVHLIVASGFRSDAEQAVLFARHPDPKWVAPPGTSLHRLATELDLGPKTAYGWLASNAGRFGFLQRYAWEPWHYGYTRNPGSNFNPFAVSPAGAQGIAQFMPGTAAGLGLHNPFDAPAAIDAQAHLMHDLLARFGSVPLALAAYNAGEAAVASCGCVPPYAETQAYVAKIIGLLGGAGDLTAGGGMEVRLVD